MKHWYRKHNDLTKSGKTAKQYVNRICCLLSKLSGRRYFAEMIKWKHCYEGHIIDTGKCIEGEDGQLKLSDTGDEIGMIFWGGHHSEKKDRFALSNAWISLLEDCIGNAENGKIADFHNLTCHLKDLLGPQIDLNCKTLDKLEMLLAEYSC